MKFYSRSYGILKNKSMKSGDVFYTLEKNGKEITYVFKNDKCPQANIGDKLYVSYQRNFSFKKSNYRQGLIISDDFFKIINSGTLMSTSGFSFFISISMLYLILSYIMFHFNHDSLGSIYYMFISLMFTCISFIGAESLWLYELFSNSEKFKQLKEYKNTQFTKKERIFNKKLNNLEKLHLINFINKRDDISPNIKIAIDDFISKEKVAISSIPYIEIKAIRRNIEKKKNMKP